MACNKKASYPLNLAKTEADRYDPSPEEIARETQQIREGWSAKEFYTRAGLEHGQRWRPPCVASPYVMSQENDFS